MADGPVVLLLSGGLDSTALAHQLVADGRAVHGLGVDYGQPDLADLAVAHHTARRLGFPFATTYTDTMGEGYPSRTGVLISLAAAHALTVGASAIAIGCHADDEGVDSQLAYLEAWNPVLAFLGLRLEYPFGAFTKADVIALARSLVDVEDIRVN